jgi:NTE family protein
MPRNSSPTPDRPAAPDKGQVVLVLQGGGALGAYHVGVYQALHEAGIEPDWVIGTSIGAINAALVAGNPVAQRMPRLDAFWQRVEQGLPMAGVLQSLPGMHWLSSATTLARGIPHFFEPNPAALPGTFAPVGLDRASYYRTEPLRRTLHELIDDDVALGAHGIRLTVGAVHVTSGTMHYFDSRRHALTIDHVMASGALPPGFPAVRVDGQPYWDGGLHSNTPIEAVFDDSPRHSSLIFAVNVWHQHGPEPESIWQVLGRQKDIQYASRDDSHIARHKQMHRLRHVIRELVREMPEGRLADERVRGLAGWGCETTMHVVHLLAPRLDGEDPTQDIDFSTGGVHARREAGLADARRMLARAPWNEPSDPIEGVLEHRL